MTCSDTLADLVAVSFILISKDDFDDGLRLTLVVTPLLMEMPAPREPVSKKSVVWSHI